MYLKTDTESSLRLQTMKVNEGEHDLANKGRVKQCTRRQNRRYKEEEETDTIVERGRKKDH